MKARADCCQLRSQEIGWTLSASSPQVVERNLVECATERVDADVVGPGVKVRPDAGGHLVGVSPCDHSLQAAVAAPACEVLRQTAAAEQVVPVVRALEVAGHVLAGELDRPLARLPEDDRLVHCEHGVRPSCSRAKAVCATGTR